MKRTNLFKVVSIVMAIAMMFSTTGVFAAAIDKVEQKAENTVIDISGVIEGTGVEPYTQDVKIIILKPASDSAIDALSSSQVTAKLALGASLFMDSRFKTAVQVMLEACTEEECADTSCANTTPGHKHNYYNGAKCEIAGAHAHYDYDITFADSVTTSPTGYYTAVVVPTVGTYSTQTFYFAASDAKYIVLQDLLTANAGTLKSSIEVNKGILGLAGTNTSWDLLSDTSKTNASTAIVAALSAWTEKPAVVNASNFDETLSKFTEITKQETYAQAVATAANDASGATLLSKIGDYTNISAYISLANSVPAKISSEGIADINSAILGQSVSDFATLVDNYKEQVIIAAVTKPADDSVTNSRAAIESFINDITSDTDIRAKYNLLSDIQKQSVALECRDSGVTTLSGTTGLTAKFEELVGALTPAGSTPTPTPAPGPDGGGGGGGGEITTVVTPSPEPTEKPIYERYTDIADVSWAWEAIEVLSDNSVFAGYSDSTFRPNNSILREEFIKIVVVGVVGADKINMSATPSFTDAKTGWFAPYVAAAETNGITTGMGDGLFGTGEKISRQDMAVMLYRILNDAGIEMHTNAYAFTDAADIAEYAEDAVYALKNMAIISGDPDGSFRPNGETTRAEAAILLYRTLDKLGKIDR